MKPFTATMCACAALLLLASCDQRHTTSVRDRPDSAVALATNVDGSENRSSLNDFADESAPTGPPSYEVAIASAAADENQAMEACDERPKAERNSCRQRARAEWEKAAAEARNIRGRTQQ